MKRRGPAFVVLAVLSAGRLCFAAAGAPTSVGLFTASQDIGPCARPGRVAFDPALKTCTLAGGGANMWFTNDAFHFVWKQMTGDVTLAAEVGFLGAGGNPHRKACLLIPQGLDPGYAYADAALHGDGLASLQCRESAVGRTYEIQARESAPRGL